MTTEEKTLRREYVLDTNILIHDPRAIYSFQEHDVVIPMTVLEELDKIKDSSAQKYSEITRDVRYAINMIAKVLEDENVDADIDAVGVSLGENMGNLRIFNDCSLSVEQLSSLEGKVPDNRILGAVSYLQSLDNGLETVLVTKDINLRLKAKGVGVVFVEDYMNDQLLADSDVLSQGYIEIPVTFFDSFKNVTSKIFPGKGVIITAPVDEFPESVYKELFPNCHLYNELESYRVTAIVDGVVYMLNKPMSLLMKQDVFGITPKNVGQAMALDALMDPDVSLVVLAGPAGSGKTLLAVAAALEQSRVGKKCLYDGIIFTRAAVPLGEEIGFLPGDESEKVGPWLGALQDSLEVLVTPHKDIDVGNPNDKLQLKESNALSIGMIMEKSGIKLRSTSFMRGRSFNNKVLIFDESQNLNRHQLKTLVTRAGYGTKCLVLGNNSQIDSRFVNAGNSGLSIASEKFKAFEGASSFVLEGGVRSPLSAFAEENL